MGGQPTRGHQFHNEIAAAFRQTGGCIPANNPDALVLLACPVPLAKQPTWFPALAAFLLRQVLYSHWPI